MDEPGNALRPDEMWASYAVEHERAIAKLGRANVLIAGNSGVGKSTIINAIFGETVAQVGVGEPQTVTIEDYRPPNRPLRIYDTRGFEISKAEITVAAVQNKIVELRASPDPNDQIHVVWTCILEQSHRVEPVQANLLAMLRSHDVPSIVIITQAFERNVDMDREVRRLAVPNDGVIPVLAQAVKIAGFEIPAFGIDELIEATIRLLPEAQKKAFIAAQTARWDIKEKEAVGVINATAITAAATAFIMVPGGPSAALFALQVGMLASITAILGLSMSDFDAKKLGGLIGIFITKYAGKEVFNLALAEALRLFPGAGTAASIVIGGPVGAALTKMLGHLYLDAVKGYAREGQPLPSDDSLSERMEQMLALNSEHYRRIAREPD